MSAPTGVSLLRADGIKPERVRWVWEGWLAAGKFHILAGQPGTGKTTIALAFAAAITRGGRWPDGTRAAPSDVVVWSGEDDPADTLVPRLLAMGADRSRVHFVGDVRDGGGLRRSFDPANDMPALERATATIGHPRLLIVDPVVSAVASDSHKNAETRRSLQPLVDLAARLDCVVLGITHLSKGTSGRDPIERVTGSLAFGALARVVLIAATRPDGAGDKPAARILARAKSNIGPDTGGFGYHLEQVELVEYPGLLAPCVVWGEVISGTARDLLAEAEPIPPMTNGEEPDQSMTDEAIELLKIVLERGAVPSKVVKQLTAEAGISAKALRTARDRLRVIVERDGFGAETKTHWSLPDCPFVPSAIIDAHQDDVAQVGRNGTSGEFADAERPAAEICGRAE